MQVAVPSRIFPDLGIPSSRRSPSISRAPAETTFSWPLIEGVEPALEESNVRNKLSRVLWIPVEGSRDIPVGDRRVGMPLLWSPE